ncbi:MAG: GGDEF domain-containing protein [Lachnospiraceae bacterium]|nr:GGDEF domain-containing protein [Candidatus Colinaster scatohippi]
MAEGKKIKNIGVLIGNFSTKHPMEVLRGLYEVAEGNDVKLTLISGAQGGIFNYWSTDTEHNEAAQFAAFDYQYNALNDYSLIAGFDAIIVAYGTISMYLSQKERETFFDKFKDIPTIVIQEYDATRNFNYIIADNYEGMKCMVEHLIEEHGRKKVVYLSGPHMNTDSVERLHGYIDAMRSRDIEITPGMIEYGDYSQTVDYLVERLLDNNPDAEAIACANDEMCLCAYRVCKKRGLVIGKDIAITGFDDVDIAAGLNPPLTTIRQDGYILGRMAMELAMEGVTNDCNKLHVMPVKLIKRASCGCDEQGLSLSSELDVLIDNFDENSDETYVNDIAERVMEESLKRAHTYEEEMIIKGFIKTHCETLKHIRELEMNESEYASLREMSTNMLSSKFRLASTTNLKFRVFLGYVDRLFDVENSHDTNIRRIAFRAEARNNIHQHMESLLVQENVQQSELLVRRYWDAPIVIRLLQQQVKDWDTFFRVAMRQIVEHGARNAYIYLNDGEIRHYKEEETVCPERMYLTASCIDGAIEIYGEKEGPVIDATHGFTSLYSDNDECMYGIFLLFSETEQYGIIVCELDTDDIAGMHGISIQISSGLSALHASRREEAIKKELYDTLRVLREKNKILSSVSSNDPMTGIFNRRGFMEKALEIIRLNEGKRAFLFFADLDHLKEINDVFGHNEGDFAINSIAECVQNIAGVKGCCARIGGDEFIALVPCDEKEAVSKVDGFRYSLSELNDRERKPYYIESSIGYTDFICEEDVVLDDIISKADTYMYEDKKKRRASVRRDVKQ